MPSLGPAEILVILVVALLVFGPDKMPEMARQAGRAFREFRRVQQHLRSEISGAMSDVGTPSDATPSAPAPGGDPVPMLPPKDADVRQPDAQPPPPGATAPASDAGAASAAVPPVPPAPGPDATGPGTPGDPA
jgi:sec-independent protein translocase protein TatA